MSWLISRVCEEFGCTPSQAWRELHDANPAGWVGQIIEARAYAATRRYVETTKDDIDDSDPLVQMVFEFEAERLGLRGGSDNGVNG